MSSDSGGGVISSVGLVRPEGKHGCQKKDEEKKSLSAMKQAGSGPTSEKRKVLENDILSEGRTYHSERLGRRASLSPRLQ